VVAAVAVNGKITVGSELETEIDAVTGVVDPLGAIRVCEQFPKNPKQLMLRAGEETLKFTLTVTLPFTEPGAVIVIVAG
jgi:hypothetical protein